MTGATADAGSTGLLPDPPPAEMHYTVISVDDHLVEPRHLFEGRLPARFAEQAPRVRTTSKGNEIWVYDGKAYPQVGLNAVAGRPKSDSPMQPVRFDQMRRGCWDIEARIADMDLGGIWASVNFPSQITGFCGTVYSGTGDPDLGLAVTRAWNDWLFEEWWSAHPDRIVPLGITFLADPEAGAEEVRRNAARGFVAVSLPEQPHRLGYPSLHSGYWDPIIAACVDTGTVICLHVGSSGMMDMPVDGAAGGAGGHAVLGAVAARLRRLGLVGHPIAVPRRAHRHVRGWHRVGADARRPPRLHLPHVGPRPPGVGRRRPARPPTCCVATSGSVRSTTRRSGRYATASASTTS